MRELFKNRWYFFPTPPLPSPHHGRPVGAVVAYFGKSSIKSDTVAVYMGINQGSVALDDQPEVAAAALAAAVRGVCIGGGDGVGVAPANRPPPPVPSRRRCCCNQSLLPVQVLHPGWLLLHAQDGTRPGALGHPGGRAEAAARHSGRRDDQ